MVIVSHAWTLGGYGPEPQAGGINLGTWAVTGFFAISGYLITRSRTRSSKASRYYRARALRILPGFLVCLVVVAFVFAPVSTLFDPAATYEPMSAVKWVPRNLPLYAPIIGYDQINVTLQHVPFPNLWDGPLWTLFWEATCYVLIGVLFSLLPAQRFRVVVPVLFVIATAVTFLGHAGLLPIPEISVRETALVTAFLAGSICLMYGDKVRAGWLLWAVAVVALVLIGVLGLAMSLAALPVAVLLILLGSVLPLSRVGKEYDVSYGIYIYGWPVQQLLALTAAPVVPVWAFVLLSLAATWPLAALSCLLIEKPALRFKRPASGPKNMTRSASGDAAVVDSDVAKS